MVERVPTGIPGLDELIEGGFPTGSVTLVSGGAGTGKTIFCSQFLIKGIKNGASGLFVTLEEEPEEIKRDAQIFGWDFDEYENAGQLKIVYLNPFKDSGGFVDHIRQQIHEIDAKRVVVDSTSVMGMYDDSAGKIRERLYELTRKLRSEGVTTLLTAEKPDESQITRFGVEDFVADGVIELDLIHDIDVRKIRVRKMRGTDIETFTAQDIHISGDGIEFIEE